MAVSAPYVPDVRRGVIGYLSEKTDAGENVRSRASRAPRRPYILVDHDGDIQQMDTRVPRGRVVIECYGATPAEARRLSYQVRDAMLPPENVTWGVHAVVEYEDEEGLDRSIVLSGAQLETGPRESATDDSRHITSYLVDYHRI